ncbi:MAG: glutathione binding-like protein [Pseudomonadota bacterium]|nr:glutathione binding-like protein [Pseudomonadota bacterium]
MTMIDLYFAPTPNGWKVTVMLEECGLPYRVHPVDLGKGEQFAPEFLKISPNNKIPAIVDTEADDLPIFETGAILWHLALKSGQFLPSDPAGATAAMQWLFWQVGGLGPMMGQHGHFKLYAPERIDYATNRYRREVLRLFGVMNARLTDAQHLAGPEISIADFACFPWVQTYRAQEIDLADFPALRDWYDRLKARPGLRRGMAVGRENIRRNPQDDPQANKILFGN